MNPFDSIISDVVNYEWMKDYSWKIAPNYETHLKNFIFRVKSRKKTLTSNTKYL